MSEYDEDTKNVAAALRGIADGWVEERNENQRLRKAFAEIVARFEKEGAAGFTLKHARCSWCGEAWPSLDGERIEALHEQTKRHGETCPKNDIRIERDRLRVQAKALFAQVAELVAEAECGWAYAPEADHHAALKRLDRYRGRR